MSLTEAEELLLRVDPVEIFRRAEMVPDPWQEAVLRSEHKRVAVCCSRQVGKSTVVAAMVARRAIFHPGSLIIIAAPTGKQSAELFRKVMQFYKAAGSPVPIRYESAIRSEFENDSRVISLPGTDLAVRSYSGPDIVVIDEASRVEDETYMALRPMLAVSEHGRLVMLTTPFGKRGFFYEEFENNQEGWERYRVPATEAPRISEEFLAQERRALGEEWFQQEYMCKFVEGAANAFRHSDILGAFDVPQEGTWF